jgi:endonuclease YncB( thermonuclease family)
MAPAHADIVGVASVVDGGTMEIHDQRIRLHEIEASESSQTCLADGTCL